MHKPKERTHVFQVWMSGEEREMLERISAEHGLTQAAMVRLLIRIRAGEVKL